jgi:SAM-dependent methyltransferase
MQSVRQSIWRQQHLPELVATLARRPGHESVRTLVADILRYGFGVAYHEIDHEVRLPEVHGRADTLFGSVVFEFKRDLRQELDDVQSRLPDYLAERERQTRRRYLGVATDGAIFIAYELREGGLVEIGKHEPNPQRAEALLAWLEPALSNRDDLLPDPLTVERELGRSSLSFARARGVLERIWEELRAHSEVVLKRQLWDGLLREAYGTPVGDDALFLQHTYLTIVAKTIACRVLDLPADDAGDILSGRGLDEVGIQGAVESDFFDWILELADGRDLVVRVARQTARFRLRDVQVDVLKSLYESLIDPAQRHDLGEYYTPDWLASKITARVLTEPLTQRVLDPACGSGTFLFHAIRRKLAAAQAAGRTLREAVALCVEQVRGLDVHPVAVIIARVTWLLALGPAVFERDGELHVPVFLGDAMQWNLRQVGDTRDVVVPVPDDAPLHVPAGFAEDQARFDRGVQTLAQGLQSDATPAQVARSLSRIDGVAAPDAAAMAETYEHLSELYRSGRNGIWPFVLRNLMRPLWLSRPDQQADVLIGNPPWIAYRHLSPEMKPRLRDACRRMNLWVGGVLATQQDMSALFWARGAERYLRPRGIIAFVLPYAALNRPAFTGLRSGEYISVQVQITEAWDLARVRPIFGRTAVGTTSTSVLFGRRETATRLPARIEVLSGTLPRRDASEEEADRSLQRGFEQWPRITTLEGASPYRERFRQGASLSPRRFFLVEREPAGRFGENPAAPRVRGRTSSLDKSPWKAVEPPRGPAEVDSLRPVLLGESIAPFRLLRLALGVMPIVAGTIVDAAQAADAGYRHLAAWLRDAEAKWRAHSNRRPDGTSRMTLGERVDHMRGLSAQLAPPQIRVVYTKAGTLLSAAILDDPRVIVDTTAYWATARDVLSARYLLAVLNSSAVLDQITPMQPRGWRDPRHFDNLVWELPIPEFDRRDRLHCELSVAAQAAERVAAAVPLREGSHFMRQRRAIRDALAGDGIAARIDQLVSRLLGG